MSMQSKVLQTLVSIAKSSIDNNAVELQTNLYVADISYSVLKNAVPTLSRKEYSLILNAFQSSVHKSSTSLGNTIKNIKSGYWTGLVYVSDSVYGEFMVSNDSLSLSRISSTVLTSLTESIPKLESVVGPKGVTLESVNTSGSLPSILQSIYKRLPILAGNKLIKGVLSKQSEHIFDMEFGFQRNKGKLSKLLGSSTVLGVIQSNARRNSLAKIESDMVAEVHTYMQSSEFINRLFNSAQLSGLTADLAYTIGKVFDPKLKKPAKPPKQAPSKVRTKPKSASSITAFTQPRLRNVETGKFTSLTNLQSLINFKLHDVVAANMGDGDRKDILNYRTGRFATSTEVTKLTQDRAGTITAFYQYMKNPYATFSAGGLQQNPRSRNPELLIGKSIREIAATHVSNKLRTVSI